MTSSSYGSYRQLRFSPQRGPVARALAKDARCAGSTG